MSIVETRTKVKFRAWGSPNYACIPQDDPHRETPSISIADLDAQALADLASAWLNDLYSKSEHGNPFVMNTEADKV
jgi:hypothetical protein